MNQLCKGTSRLLIAIYTYTLKLASLGHLFGCYKLEISYLALKLTVWSLAGWRLVVSSTLSLSHNSLGN